MEVDALASTPPKLSEVAIVPYVDDGGWTVPDSMMRDIFTRMRKDGIAERVFYEGHIRSADEFLTIMKQPANLPVVLFVEGQPVGVGWLNGINGHRAYGHFFLLKMVWGTDSVRVVRVMVSYWMSLKDESGPILNVILAVIPTFNTLAIRFAQRVGFTLLGVIPKLSKGAKGEPLDSAVLYYSRS